ncbi:MAG: choice-of-anchor J domain-containing protein, partial [Bacteroidales bacterium]|nr:choice-of-anchor J domain-containing protein [Bacteroidales bacterium]
MKKITFLALLAMLLPLGARAQLSGCTGSTCSIVIQMYDDYGDGWYDSYNDQFYVQVYQGTTLRGQASISTGYAGQSTIQVCSNEPVTFKLYGDDSYEESSFVVRDELGGLLLDTVYCYDFSSGQTMGTIAAPCPTCIMPAVFYADNVSSTGATLHWSPGQNDLSYEVSLDGITWTPVNDTFYDLTGLTANTIYTARVRILCGGDDTSAVATCEFEAVDFLPITEFPYTIGFEQTWDGWRRIDQDGDGRNWFFSDGTFDGPAHGGSYQASSWSYDADEDSPTANAAFTPNNLLVSRPIEVSEGLRLTYWVRSGCGNTGSYPDRYALYIATDISNFNTLTASTPVFNEQPPSAWTLKTVDLSSYENQTIYLVFRHFNSDNMCGIMLDDITIQMAGTPEVTMPSLSYTTNVGDTLTITSSVIGTNLNYSWTSLMEGTGDAVMFEDDSVLRIVYSVGGTDTIDFVVSNTYGTVTNRVVVTVIDLQPVTEFPYSTGFEEGDDTAWFRAGAINNWTVGNGTHNGTGTEALYVSNNGTSFAYTVGTTSTIYAYRAMTFTAGEYGYSYDWLSEGDGIYHFMRSFIVPVSTALVGGTALPGLNYNSQPDGSISMDNGHMSGSTSWQSQSGTFAITIPGTYLVVFSWTQDGYTNYSSPRLPGAIDNLIISRITCSAPVGLTVSDIDDGEATLSWTTGGEESEWAVRLDNGEWQVVTTNPYTLTDLLPSHSYNVSVRAVCGDGDTSFNAATTTFFTPCALLTQADLPISDNFDSYAPDGSIHPCWSKHNFYTSGSYNYPSPNSSQNHTPGTGGKSLYFYNGGSAQYNYVVLPPVDDLNGTMITFWTYASTPGSIQFQVGTMSTSTDFANFTPIYTTPTTMAASQWVEHEVIIPAGVTNQYLSIRNQGSSYTTGYVDDITLAVAPDCMRPAGVSVSDVSTTEATINISDPSATANYAIIIKQGNTVVDSVVVTDTSYTVSTLASSTAYTVTAYSICDDGMPTGTVSTVFSTTMESTSLPYATGFEPGEDTAWAMFNGANGWYIGTATSNGGSRSLYVSSNNGTTNGYNNNSITMSYAVRALDFENAGEYFYSFDWKGNGESDYDYIRAWISPGSATYTADYAADGTLADSYNYRNSTPAGWIDLGNGQLRGQSNWQTKSGTVQINTPGIYNLVFLWANDGSSGSGSPAIDNVAIGQLTCPVPTALSVSGISETEATLSWTAGGEESEWIVSINGGDWVTVTSNPYTLTGLTSSTQYNVRLRAVCGAGDTSLMTANTAFRTSCGAITTLPWTEGFENYNASGGSGSANSSVTNIPCWDFNGLNGNNTYVTTSQHHEGSNAVRYYGSNSYPSYMVLPPFQDDLSGLMFTFWMRSASTNAYVGVGYMTNPADPTTYTEVGQARASATNTWEFKDIVLGSSATGRIALRYYGSSQNIYLDEFTVTTAPSCLRPATVTASNVTQTSADINIDDVNNTNHYMVYYTAGSTTDSVEAFSTSVSLTGLTSATQYTVSVITLCSDGTRTVATSAEFITNCDLIATLPWTEDFTQYANLWGNGDYQPACWVNHYYSSGSNLYPYVNGVGHTSGGNSLCYRAGRNDYPVLVLPSFAYSLSDLEVSFWLTGFAGSTTMEVGYVSNAADRNSFVPVASFNTTASDDWQLCTATFPATASGRIAFRSKATTSNDDGSRLTEITVSLTDTTVTPQPPTTYTVSAATADATMGAATVTPSGTVNAGTSVTFTATANTGYHFVAWTANGQQVS